MHSSRPTHCGLLIGNDEDTLSGTRARIGAATIMLVLTACNLDATEQHLEARRSPLATLGIDRVIPVRFVDFSASSVSDAQLRAQVEGANTIYKSAGIQFVIAAEHTLPGTVFSDLSSGSYTWPQDLSTATPLTFNPTCSPFTRPPGGTEGRSAALFRAGSYCSLDGEILVYIVDSGVLGNSGTVSQGGFPTTGNMIQMQSADLGWAPPPSSPQPNRTFAHELGHYLGLVHPHDGDNSFLNPETNQTTLSDQWDLVYVKAADRNATTNLYFSTKDAAAQAVTQYGESHLHQIMASAPCNSCTPGQPGNLCPETRRSDGSYLYPEGTVRISVPTGLTGHPTETLYTGDPGMKGVGFVTAAYDPSGDPNKTTYRAVNLMSYGCAGPPGVTLDDLGAELSESQVLQVRRTLRFEVSDQFGLPSRRPKLGLGSRRALVENVNFDGVGGRDLAIYNPIAHTFTVQPSGSDNSYSGAQTNVSFGRAGDVPVLADYDADGKTDYAVVTFSAGATSSGAATWRWCPSSVTVNQGSNPCARVENVTWGDRTMKFIPGVDFDSDSTTPEIALWSPQSPFADWFWATLPKPAASAPAGEYSITLVSQAGTNWPGGPSSEPLLGLYDSDTKTDIAVWDAPSHVFALRLSTENYQTIRGITFPAPTGSALPIAIRGLKNTASGRLALAAFYPGGNVNVLWNPQSLPTSWSWGAGGPATTTSCPTVSPHAVPVSGFIDVHNDGVADIVQYDHSGDSTYGIFFITPIGTNFACQPSYNVGVRVSGDPLKLAPFIIGDMKGDRRNELGVLNTDTQAWTFFPSDGIGYAGWNSFGLQFGNVDAQPL